MKKIITFLILIQSTLLFSQTVLSTFPLELKKSKEYKQVVNAENTATHDVFAFVSDKETLTILKYNSALFLTSHYTFARPDSDYKAVSGYSFDEQGNPTLYWSSEDLKKMLAVQYNLSSNTIATFSYYNSFSQQSIIAPFQENNTFYILAQKASEQKLVLYIFKNGQKEEKTIDFSSFKFTAKKGAAVTLDQILQYYPIEKIETNQFNPLFKGTQKSKIYVLKNRLLLTLDYNGKETQAFEIDLNTLEIQEKKFLQPITKKQTAWFNSYYHENKIYQVNLNEEELLFDIKDYQTGQSIKSYTVAKTDTISFKTSPLWLQFEGQKPKEFRNTSKFLNQLIYLEMGLTVYKTPNSILVTIGGTGTIQFTDYANSFSGGQFNNDIQYRNIPTTVYFESVFDKKLDYNKKTQEPLAFDFISGFEQEHPEVTLPSIIRYKNYYILGYYDSYAKQYTMRKFIDGFERSF